MGISMAINLHKLAYNITPITMAILHTYIYMNIIHFITGTAYLRFKVAVWAEMGTNHLISGMIVFESAKSDVGNGLGA